VVIAAVSWIVGDDEDTNEEEIMNDYRDDEAVLRKALLEIAVEAWFRLGRAERLVEKRKRELNLAVGNLDPADLADYFRQTENNDEEE